MDEIFDSTIQFCYDLDLRLKLSQQIFMALFFLKEQVWDNLNGLLFLETLYLTARHPIFLNLINSQINNYSFDCISKSQPSLINNISFMNITTRNIQPFYMAMVSMVILSSITGTECSCNFTSTLFSQALPFDQSHEFNTTFDKINQNGIAISPKSVKSGTTTYTLSDIKTKCLYHDENQSRTIGQNSINIQGGPVTISISFNWTKKGTLSTNSGNGIAQLSTKPVSLSQTLNIDEQFVSYKLVDSNQIENSSLIAIKNTSKSLSEADTLIFTNILNNDNQTKSVMSDLLTFMKQNYKNILSSAVSANKESVSQNFEYKWPQKSITIPFQSNITGAKFNQKGTTLFRNLGIVGYEDWHCDQPSPEAPYDITKYDMQEIVTIDVYTNIFKYSAAMKAFDAQLDDSWSSRAFQFYAGDLYEPIPKIREEFTPQQRVSGVCSADANSSSIEFGNDNNQLLTKTTYECFLQIKEVRIVDFNISASFEVKVNADPSQLLFKINKATITSIQVLPNTYEVKNLSLFLHKVSTCFESSLAGQETFGTHWTQIERENPQFVFVDHKYAFSYENMEDSAIHSE